MNCKQCKCQLKPGKAIQNTVTGMADFIGGSVITFRPGGPGRLIDCLKCHLCGYSVHATDR